MVNLFFRYHMCTIYEIYPRSTHCSLSKIAHLGYDISTGLRNCVIPNTVAVVWYNFYKDRIVFWVWDYRLNHSISFSVHVELEDFDVYPEVYSLTFR